MLQNMITFDTCRMCYQCCRFSSDKINGEGRDKNACEVHTMEFNKKAGNILMLALFFYEENGKTVKKYHRIICRNRSIY